MISPSAATSRPLQTLFTVFTAWKALLLAIALGAAVGPDYDTSTSLFFERLYGEDARIPAVAARLTRWDGLYYMHAARDRYVYEQEWAFGTGLPLVVGVLVQGLRLLGVDADGVALEPVIAVAIAHVSHLAAVLALYKLTLLMTKDTRQALIASILHIISPAGLFMSAPYSESSCSCFSFLGNLLFAHAIINKTHTFKASALVVAAGVSFGIATAFRSNALLSGVLFAGEAIRALLKLSQKPTLSRATFLASIILGGLCVAAGLVIPQAVAWVRYCRVSAPGADLRPWCSHTVPSIYTFVQDHYWDNGFLRYWTLNQLPLFLLAAPMLSVLLASGMQTLREPSLALKSITPGTSEPFRTFVRTLATVQTLLATLAVTHYHVQIVTRLSSAYPVWYWWVAGCLLDKKRQPWGIAITMFMVMYAGIQGGLFASFLPPA